MALPIFSPVTVWTDLFQKGWKRKKHHSELLSVFRVLYTILHDKVQGTGCSHILVATETKEDSISSSPAWFSLIIYVTASSTEIKGAFWGRRDFAHPRASIRIFKSAYTGCHFTGAFISENHLPKWLHQPCREKNLTFSPYFSGVDGYAFGK